MAQAPSSPSSGWAYYNTAKKTAFIWDGDSWEILMRDGTDGQDGASGILLWLGALTQPPGNSSSGYAYHNSTNGISYIWDGDSWDLLAESGSSTILVSISWKGALYSAPLNPQIGWMYYNPNLGKSYVWDGVSWSIAAQDGTSHKPTNAVIDSGNNLYVSDGYYTIKFSQSGTEAWRKDTGGTLYLDSQNNVFIVSASSITKYSGSGAQLWTKEYAGRLVFDNSGNILVYSGDAVRYLNTGGLESWGKQSSRDIYNSTPNNGWYNREVMSSYDHEYWTFQAVSGQSYAISWNGYVNTSAFWEDGNSLISDKPFGSSPGSFTVSKSDN
ncbi:MAG: hypothetical protein LBU18_04090 [Treponema sp.]|nr:hypothetical protein [Treponema sp.]